MAIIYKITNLINNKEYVGQFSDINKKFSKYWGGGHAIKKAIQKYGKENFKKEIIVEGDFNQLLKDELEKHYIRLYNSITPYGYNLTIGGQGAGLLPQKVNQYTLQGEFIKSWNSTKEISKILNIANSTLRSCCNGNHYKCGGFIFLYEDDSVEDRILKIIDSKEKRKLAAKNRKPSSHYRGCIRVYKPLQYSLDGILIKEWTSCKEAANDLNLSQDTIRAAVKSMHYSMYNNFIWANSIEDVEIKLKIQRNKKKLIEVCKDGKLIKLCRGLKEASILSGHAECTISLHCLQTKPAPKSGYTFKYITE